MAVQNTLPDPNNTITAAGTDAGGGTAGPGFQSVQLSSIQPILRDRTNSGRIISRSHVYHKWEISLTYNPLTKAEFDPVYNFLLHKRGTLKPFFVSLPQYRAQGPTGKSFGQNEPAGKTTPLTLNNTTGIEPGMLFTIADSADSSHTKAYIVTQVVDSTDITITPGLAKAVTGGATLDFADPKIKVIQSSDTRQYNLNVDNLYSFSLKLEEVSQ